MAFKIRNRQGQRQQPVGGTVQKTFAEDDEDEALQVSEAMLEEAKALKEQGQNFAVAEQWQAALRCWDRALQLDVGDGSLYELRAQVLLELGLGWEAVQAASRATQLQPQAPVAFLTLARAQLSYGEPQMAVSSFQRVLQLQPGHSEALAECNEAKVLALQQQRSGGAIRAHVVSNLSVHASIHQAEAYSPVHMTAGSLDDMATEQRDDMIS